MFSELTHDDIFRLETRRLWLRWPTHADADGLQAIAAHREVAEMTATWPHPLPDGEARRRIVAMRRTNLVGRTLVLVLTPKSAPDEILGCAGVHALEPGALDLGYFLAPAQWGRGLMTEAIDGLVEASFLCSSADYLRAGCWSDNHASRRVLEKCGFAAVGLRPCHAPARGGEGPAEHFELARAVWQASRSRRLAA